MPPNRFESEVESFLEGSHGDRTHIKRADHHTVTPLCGTLLLSREERSLGLQRFLACLKNDRWKLRAKFVWWGVWSCRMGLLKSGPRPR